MRGGDEGTRGKGEMEMMGKGDLEKGRKGEKTGRFPDKVMFTFHPQRWHASFAPWLKELVFQNMKNQVKRVLIK